MTFKECIIFILAINLNPLGLWINSFTFEKFFNQETHCVDQDKIRLPSASGGGKIEQINQNIVR